MKTKALATSAIMLAIIIVMGAIPSIPLGFIPVPIVLQNMGIMLAGIILGKKYGFFTVVGFLCLAALGLPILSGGHGGFVVFVGPTAGYLYAYPIAAFLIGWASEWLIKNNKFSFFPLLIVILLFGVLLIDILGAIGLNIVANMPLDKALLYQVAFIPGDIIKSVLGVAIAMILNKRHFIL
ncbi:biotin transporter BioY [Leuconostoc litchii]|uniref:Biotin transporter n=1 Tax=Leuconostoc litchii TaxID=1981069 RepID=A0A6P2CT11_9LACO|nr:biotin transporter BioY [Leuconostoc litchii]TYC47407.1 biotin transporter BioY [Leuconostoc litchii]GMA69422.1 biotin transporter BioY [Leuconostoc litchii]